MTTIESEIIKLPAELDIKAAAPLTERLLALRGGPLVVSGADVERAGAQCLQVLLSAAATWRADSQDLEFVDASEPLIAAIETCGLDLSHFTAGGQ